jgi:hypothetical protein
MHGDSTTILDPACLDGDVDVNNYEDYTRDFRFDYSFARVTPQDVIFEELGNDMLDSAWEGYNCSMFVYGGVI